jgi:cysteine synthase A
VLVAGETLDAEQGGPACLGIPGVIDCMSGLLDEAELGGHHRWRYPGPKPWTPPASWPAEASRSARPAASTWPGPGPCPRARPGPPVATVACDRMERYFSTDLFDDLR